MSELGEITRCYTMTYERRSKHAADRLWRAITDSGEVASWMGYHARIDLRIGGDYFVDFTPTSDENLDGILVRIEPAHQLTYVWGLSVVEWTLEPDGDGCRYTFVHHGMPRRDIPDEQGVAFGWHLWLDDLENYLSGVSPSEEEKRTQYKGMSEAYGKRLDVVLGLG